jgi:hypothetical protein
MFGMLIAFFVPFVVFSRRRLGRLPGSTARVAAAAVDR